MKNDERSHFRGSHRSSDGRFDPSRTGSIILDHGGLKLDCMLLLRTSLGLARAAGSFGGYGNSSVGVSLCHKIITKASKERTSDRIWLWLGNVIGAEISIFPMIRTETDSISLTTITMGFMTTAAGSTSAQDVRINSKAGLRGLCGRLRMTNESDLRKA